MSNQTRWSTLFLFIALATVFYILGFTSGAVVLISLGVLFEIAFWVRLFRGRNAD